MSACCIPASSELVQAAARRTTRLRVLGQGAHLVPQFLFGHSALAVDDALTEHVLHHQSLLYTLRVVVRDKAKAAGDATLIGHDDSVRDVAVLFKVLAKVFTGHLTLHTAALSAPSC